MLLEEAKKYYELGWQVIPYVIQNGDVQPTVAYSKYYNKREFKDFWFNESTQGIALVCGAVSGVVALDIDNIDHKFFEEVKKILKGYKTPRAKTNKGYHVFFKYSEDFNSKLQYKDNSVNIFDIQTNKSLINIPPSLHKNGTYNYKWINDPFTTSLIDMPEELKELILSYTKKEIIVKQQKTYNNSTDLLSKLKSIPITDVASRLGLDLDRDNKVNCFMPGHKDTHKSLSFDIEKNFFHCFGCQDNSGDTIKLVQNFYDYDFKQALAWLNYQFFGETTINSKPEIKEDLKQFDDIKKLFDHMLSKIKPINFEKQALERGVEIPGSGLSFKIKKVLIIFNLLDILKKECYPLMRNDVFLYIYNGSYWVNIEEDYIKKFISNVAFKMGLTDIVAYEAKNAKDLFEQLQTSMFRDKNKEQDIIEINLNNGIIQFKDGLFIKKPFSSESFFTYKLKFDYNPKASCPLFFKFLDRVLPDESDKKTLQEYLGYVFTKNSFLKLEKTLWNFGEGHNGKSVLHDICYGLYGAENISSFGINDLEEETNRALLSDKLLNYASESGKLTDTEVFKKLTSGETINARHLYGRPFQITDYARILFNTNRLPPIVEHNFAFFRRFLLLNWDQRITDEEKDPNLAKKIKEKELSGVFNWALEGLVRIVNNKEFTISDKSKALLNKYIQETDNVAMFINSDNMMDDKEIKASELYDNYKRFCIIDGYKVLTKTNFYERFMKATNLYERRNKHSNVLYFIKKDPVRDAEEKVHQELMKQVEEVFKDEN